MIIGRAEKSDLPEILELQYAAYRSEAKIYEDDHIPPLIQTIEQLESEHAECVFFKSMIDYTIVGSVRVSVRDRICTIGKLIVKPEYQNRGIGKQLMRTVEESFPNLNRIELFTGHKSVRNLQFYKNLGYKPFKEEKINEHLTFIYLYKQI